MNVHYKVFRLKTKESHEPDGYDYKTIETSKLEHVNCGWIESKEDALVLVGRLCNGFDKFVIIEVYS